MTFYLKTIVPPPTKILFDLSISISLTVILHPLSKIIELPETHNLKRHSSNLCAIIRGIVIE